MPTRRPKVRFAIQGMLLAVLSLTLAPGRSPAQAPPQDPRPSGTSEKTALAKQGSSPESQMRHPLDPLEPNEIRLAVNIVRREKKLAEGVRFVTVTLNEPAKAALLRPEAGGIIPREVFMVLLDNGTGRGYEAVVNFAKQSVTRFDALPPGVQPSITLDEFVECEEAARKSRAFLEALKKRGITDSSLVMVDAWSAGHYGNEPLEDGGKRLVRALSWVRSDPLDNGYARPIEGLVTVIDLNRKGSRPG